MKFLTINLRKNKSTTEIEKKTRAKLNPMKIVDVCLVLALIAVSIYLITMVASKEYHGDAIFVNSNAKKKLPIYSVETDKPKVAISFDAAWGEGWLLEILKAWIYLISKEKLKRDTEKLALEFSLSLLMLN